LVKIYPEAKNKETIDETKSHKWTDLSILENIKPPTEILKLTLQSY